MRDLQVYSGALCVRPIIGEQPTPPCESTERQSREPRGGRHRVRRSRERLAALGCRRSASFSAAWTSVAARKRVPSVDTPGDYLPPACCSTSDAGLLWSSVSNVMTMSATLAK